VAARDLINHDLPISRLNAWDDMTRNLVLCCDGTSNQFGVINTNVVHLYYTLVQDATQLTYYHPGLGTMGAPGAWTRLSQTLSRVFGLAFGRGIADDLGDAYVFLMHNAEPDDRIFLFGFSRGAYTARALAGMLYMFGLMRRGHEPLVPYAIRMLTKINQHTFEVARNFRTTFSRECNTHFVGVWDTVSSVGWFWNPLVIPYSADNPGIAIGRHAISIDEHRAFFRSNLWHMNPTLTAHGPTDVKQVWFPGAHCDVGGGYLEQESGLSKLALEWMLREAQAGGLKCQQTRVDEVLGRAGSRYCRPDPTAVLHESLTTIWWPAEFVPKWHYDIQTRRRHLRMNLFRRRAIPDGSLVHRAALRRGSGYPKNKPSIYTEVN
jgi:uncharacterized protein (DUF2235 family)